MDKENTSTGNVFSETASENKRRRGRPTVFERDHMECMESLCTANKYRTRRNHVATYYRSSVFGILEDRSDIPYLAEIFRIDGDACIQKDEIIESSVVCMLRTVTVKRLSLTPQRLRQDFITTETP